jgi:4-hydroxy-tetrahydrodipicolinate synthase
MTRHEHAPRFGSVLTAMVTPFDERGELDLDGAASLARWLVGHGSEGLVVAGSTGEGTVLSDDEKLSLWRAVAEAVTVPVIAATGSNDTRHSIELTAQAAGLGVAGVLVVTPYYSRPSQQGLLEHFGAVAAATELPVILYDVPIRSGRRIATDVMVRLVKNVGNIVALKDSVRDPESSARLLNLVPSSFELYCGDDSLTLPLLSIGAVGVISVASHWIGRELHAVVAAFLKGDVEGACLANRRLIESYDFEASDEFPNPMPAKAACRVQGLAVGHCRAPHGTAPPELDGEARRVLVRAGVPVA